MAMKTAFCCTTLKTGTIIVGWINLVYTLFELIMRIMALSGAVGWIDGYYSNSDLPASLQKTEFNNQEQSQKIITFHSILCGLAVMNVAFMVSVLYGAYKGVLWFLVPYLFLYGIAEILITLDMADWNIIALITGLSTSQMVFYVVSIPITIYFYCIVWFYFEQLWSQNKSSKDKVLDTKDAISSV